MTCAKTWENIEKYRKTWCPTRTRTPKSGYLKVSNNIISQLILTKVHYKMILKVIIPVTDCHCTVAIQVPFVSFENVTDVSDFSILNPLYELLFISWEHSEEMKQTIPLASRNKFLMLIDYFLFILLTINSYYKQSVGDNTRNFYRKF